MSNQADRDRKVSKRRYGMRVSGRSVRLLATLNRVPKAAREGRKAGSK